LIESSSNEPVVRFQNSITFCLLITRNSESIQGRVVIIDGMGPVTFKRLVTPGDCKIYPERSNRDCSAYFVYSQ